MENGVASMENSLVAPQKENIELSYEPQCPLLGILVYPQIENRNSNRYWYTNVYTQNVGMTHVH